MFKLFKSIIWWIRATPNERACRKLRKEINNFTTEQRLELSKQAEEIIRLSGKNP